MYGLDQFAHMDLDKRAQDGSCKHHHRADGCCSGHGVCFEGEAWRKNDHHTDQAERDSGETKQTDPFTQKEGSEKNGKHWGSIADSGDFGQGEQTQTTEGESHGCSAKQAAQDVADEILRDEARAQVVLLPEPQDNHGKGKDGPEEDGLWGRNCGRSAFYQGGHHHEKKDRA